MVREALSLFLSEFPGMRGETPMDPNIRLFLTKRVTAPS